jgi:hypothetical protein
MPSLHRLLWLLTGMIGKNEIYEILGVMDICGGLYSDRSLDVFALIITFMFSGKTEANSAGKQPGQDTYKRFFSKFNTVSAHRVSNYFYS